MDATFPKNLVNYLIILHFIDFLLNFIFLSSDLIYTECLIVKRMILNGSEG